MTVGQLSVAVFGTTALSAIAAGLAEFYNIVARNHPERGEHFPINTLAKWVVDHLSYV